MEPVPRLVRCRHVSTTNRQTARTHHALTRRFSPRRDVRRRRRSRVVDLVLPALDSEWAVEIIRGVISSELDAVVSALPDGPDRHTLAERLAGAGRAGVIVVTSEFTATQKRVFRHAGIPCVVVDPVDLPDPDVPSVGATNWGGGLAATRHLLELGHRRIAVIGGPKGLLCSQARIDGYRAALESAGVPYDAELVRDGTFHHAGGYEVATALLARPDPPTAVFAGSDEQAFGVLEAARVAGLSVPRDLSVVGFDDLPVSRWAAPPLTTVRQPLADMGRVGAQMLLTLIEGRELDAGTSSWPPGWSSGRPRPSRAGSADDPRLGVGLPDHSRRDEPDLRRTVDDPGRVYQGRPRLPPR
jgi:LacI family transcriptional regulator